MDSDHALVLFLGLVLVGSAVAIAYSYPSVLGGSSDAPSDANLASFDTTEPYCGDPNTTSNTAINEDITGGGALVINGTIPVPSNDTQVSAALDEVGPQRYVLAVARETPEPTPTPTPTPTATERPTENRTASPPNESASPGTETAPDGNGTDRPAANETTATVTPTPTATERTESDAQCYREVSYNASIHLAQPDEFTVLVTYDDELVNAYWQDGDDSGSYDKVPDRPEPTEDGNDTATTSQSVR